MGMMAAAEQPGGAWDGFAVVGSLVFGILLPALLGLLTLGGGACLLVLRRQLIARECDAVSLPPGAGTFRTGARHLPHPSRTDSGAL